MRESVNSNMMRLFQILLLLGFSQHTLAVAPKIMERIDVAIGEEQNRITVHFNLPVQYVTHVSNKANNEITVQFRPTLTPGFSKELLDRNETLSWHSSAEVPLRRVEFRGETIGLSSISYSFSTPVNDYSIERRGDSFSISLLLKKLKEVKHLQRMTTPSAATLSAAPKEKLTIQQKAATDPVADKGYVINLSSRKIPIDFAKIAPIPIADGKQLYTTQTSLEGQVWHRLRLGFYQTATDAQSALKEIRHYYPKAWIDHDDGGEKSRILSLGKPLDESLIKGSRLPARDPTQSAPSEKTERMISKAREVMTAGDYPVAIRLLTAVLEEGDTTHHQEALEMLGLAREHNRQLTHAGSIYGHYLELYPEGDAAERVRQRLAGVVSADAMPREKLRELKKVESEDPWELYGSLSQNYRFSGLASDFSDTDDAASQSSLSTGFDLSASRDFGDYEIRGELSTSHTKDFRDATADDASLYEIYMEAMAADDGWLGRLGRQRLNSSGILNRFDGAVAEFQTQENTRVGVYAGIPVESTSDLFIRGDKHFVGANAAFEGVIENWDFNLFIIDQRVHGLVDRRAIGGEARYFDPTKSLFGLIDYDIHHDLLTTTMLQGSWALDDDTRLYSTLDYRTSPFITTSNALTGQTVSSIDQLKTLFTASEIRQLAKDRSAESRTVSFGGSKSLSEHLQVSADLTASNTSGTPASGGVDATEATGTEYYLTLQSISNNILKEGDVGILGFRYSDASANRAYTLSANSRYPISSLWRISPVLASLTVKTRMITVTGWVSVPISTQSTGSAMISVLRWS